MQRITQMRSKLSRAVGRLSNGLIAITKSERKLKITWLVGLVSFAICVAILQLLQWQTTNQFSLPAVIVPFVAGGIAFVLGKFPAIRRMVGEDKISRNVWHWFAVWGSWMVLFLPLSIYVLINELSVTDSKVAQLSIVAMAPTLGGLVLAAASRSEWQTELVRVARKFILATVLFIIVIPSLFVVDRMSGIDIYSGDRLALKDWVRGSYFWLAAPCFFVGISLFLVGLIDLMFALSRLGSETHTGRQEVRSVSK
jgi:hypothetical protein